VDAVLLARDRLDGQRNCGVADVGDRVDTLLVYPLARDVGADIGLVLVVGKDDLDRFAEHLAAIILDGHARGDHRSGTGIVGIQARLVVQDTDPHDVPGHIGRRRQSRRHQGRTDQQSKT